MDHLQKDEKSPNHWRLIRDIAVFQCKLALDGLRDLVLLPVSLIAGLIGVVTSPDNPGKYFNQLLEFGHKSDVWINLFGASEQHRREAQAHEMQDESQEFETKQQDDDVHAHQLDGQAHKTQSSDDYLERLEQMLIDEYQKGGMVRNIKDRTDHLIERIQSEASKSMSPDSKQDSPIFRAKPEHRR